MAINVTENDDGSITIEWDEHDDYEKMYNDWSENDFIAALTSGILAVAQNTGYDVSGNTVPGVIVESPETSEQSVTETSGLTEENKEG